MDGVAIGAGQRRATPPPASGTTCRTMSLPFTGPVRVAVLLDVHMSTTDGWAYLAPDDYKPPAGCPSTPPASFKGSPCASTIPAGGWTQVPLRCDIASNQTAVLRINGTATSPRQVFAAPQDPQASSLGSVYLLAIQSPVPGAMEEALFFVSSDHRTNRLQYEAPLLP